MKKKEKRWNTSAKFNRKFFLLYKKNFFLIFCFSIFSYFSPFLFAFFSYFFLIYCYDKCHCLLNEKDSLGRAFFLPRIKYCSSRMRFSCSRCMRCRSSSILRCCSTIAKRSSACRLNKHYFKVPLNNGRLWGKSTIWYQLELTEASNKLLHTELNN